MWFVRWFFFVVFVSLLLWFAFQNAHLTVEGMRVFTYDVPRSPLILVLLAAFLAGVVFMFCVASIEYLKLYSKLRSNRKEYASAADRLRGFEKLHLDEIDEAIGRTGGKEEGTA